MERGSPAGATPPDAPLAVVAKVESAMRIVALDEVASGLGLRLGTSLADARAAFPALRVAEADPAADLQLLEALADWCDRYTPLVALDPPAGLLLDISGCAHLFRATRFGDGGGESGETALLGDCLRRLHAQGFAAGAAIASTIGAASALARHAGRACAPPGGEAEALATLPVAALRIDAGEAQLLARLGLRRIGQVAGLPRGALVARFGAQLVRRLDQALGREAEVLSPRRPPPLLAAERRFQEPIADEPAVLAVLAALARRLEPALERHGFGARRLEATLFRTDGHVLRIGVGTARPLREAAAIARLFEERLAALRCDWDAGFGFDTLRLAVPDWQPLDPLQVDLAGAANGAADVDALVDRLGARLGADRVTRWQAVDTHLPERAVRAVPAVDAPLAETAAGRASPSRLRPAATGWAAAPAPAASWMAASERPLKLFEVPEPLDEVLSEVPDGPPLRFRWRRALYEIRRYEGPERIAPEWWRQASESEARDGPARLSAPRDYFRVEDAEGRRYWVFRLGLYEEADRPRWYVHGLFG